MIPLDTLQQCLTPLGYGNANDTFVYKYGMAA
jgi:hypothetical protein